VATSRIATNRICSNRSPTASPIVCRKKNSACWQTNSAPCPKIVANRLNDKKIETWLDAGLGCCALRHPEVARYVLNSFLHFHGERYHLHAWCIMPNHVHVLIEPLDDLASIVQGWKSFTSRWVLARNTELRLCVPGKNFWMREYWDRYIRDETHYQKTVDYIHQNPVSARLCATPEAWPWSSASGRSQPLTPARIFA